MIVVDVLASAEVAASASELKREIEDQEEKNRLRLKQLKKDVRMNSCLKGRKCF